MAYPVFKPRHWRAEIIVDSDIHGSNTVLNVRGELDFSEVWSKTTWEDKYGTIGQTSRSRVVLGCIHGKIKKRDKEVDSYMRLNAVGCIRRFAGMLSEKVPHTHFEEILNQFKSLLYAKHYRPVLWGQ
jgi:hypothetical protein